jgi:phage shock protein C
MRSVKLYRRRRTEGGVLLGLCAGIGDHLGLDPVFVRLILIMLLFLNPGGLALVLIYLLFSLLLPYEPQAGNPQP